MRAMRHQTVQGSANTSKSSYNPDNKEWVSQDLGGQVGGQLGGFTGQQVTFR